MKVQKKLFPVLLIGLLAPVIVAGVTTAQTDDSETTSTSEARDARIAERKAAMQTRLTTAQQTRVRARCKAAQTVLVAYQKRVDAFEKNRTQAHEKILNKLNEIITNVGDEADTTSLQTATAELKTKTDALDAALAEYKQSVADLAELDCVADPTAFQATLVDVRTERAELAKQAGEVRAYVNSSIKPLLVELRQALKGGETE